MAEASIEVRVMDAPGVMGLVAECATAREWAVAAMRRANALAYGWAEVQATLAALRDALGLREGAEGEDAALLAGILNQAVPRDEVVTCAWEQASMLADERDHAWARYGAFRGVVVDLGDGARDARVRASAIGVRLRAARNSHDSGAESAAEADAYLLLCEQLGILDYKPRHAVAVVQWLRSTIAAIRDALGCEPGGEVKAVQAIALEVADALNADGAPPAGKVLVAQVTTLAGLAATLRMERDALAADCDTVAARLEGTPTPGDVLNPADFGKGEAGVLRLAALLAEAPEGAVVRCRRGHDWRWEGNGLWVGAVVRRSLPLAEAHAPLTVVAWPGGAS